MPKCERRAYMEASNWTGTPKRKKYPRIGHS